MSDWPAPKVIHGRGLVHPRKRHSPYTFATFRFEVAMVVMYGGVFPHHLGLKDIVCLKAPQTFGGVCSGLHCGQSLLACATGLGSQGVGVAARISCMVPF